MKTSDLQVPPHQKMVKFRELIPGLAAILRRLPTVIRTLKMVLNVSDESGYSIGGIIEENAVKFKERTALVFEDNSWTYQAFNREANRVASFLLSNGVKKGDNIVSFLNNRPEMLFTVSAAAKIGARVSLINFNLRQKALSHCVTIMPASLYLVDEELVDAFDEIRKDLPEGSENRLFYVADSGTRSIPTGYKDFKKGLENASDQNPATTSSIKLSDAFCYIFTSGTTGFPKAAIQYQKSFFKAANFVGTVCLDTKKEDRVFVVLPFFHSVALKLSWLSTHINGATLIMQRKFSTRSFWDDIRKYEATTFFYIGELCSYLVNQPEKDNDGDNPIQKILGNGLRPEIWKTFKNRFKIPKIVEFYGASESNGGFFNILNVDETVGMGLEKHAVVAYDIEEEVFARDEKGFLKKTASGGVGMLIFETPEGKGQFTGYTDKNETEKKILRDVFEKGDRWFNTGDLMRPIGYGHYQFADRVGDTFRWKGENVATHEIEEIVNSFHEVAQSTTYGISMPGSDGRLGMTAVIPFTDFEAFDVKGFAEHLTRALPAYAVPRFLRFKTNFDTTATHKIKKTVLQNDGFNLDEIDDPLYILRPGGTEFEPLTPEVYHEVLEGSIRF